MNTLAYPAGRPNPSLENGLNSKSPNLVCYCFDYTLENIAVDLATHHRSTILPAITAEVQAGNCACDTKNPSGKCCLADVKRAIQACGLEAEDSI